MRLRAGAANFSVDELPAHEPSGSGEHLYVHVEKRELNTDDVVDALARATGRSQREVGYAGRKDRIAIARQWFSVQLGDEARLAELSCARPRLPEPLPLQQAPPRPPARNRFRLGLEGAGRTSARPTHCAQRPSACRRTV